MNLFGKAKSAPQPKDAIIRLRETLDLLEKREKYLQTKMDGELRIAKANATKNKRAALMALKRKKAYESQMDKLSNARLTIEVQVMTIENANVNLEAFHAMKAGASAMKQIHGNMNIEMVENTMDDIREQVQIIDEISDSIGQPIGLGAELDDDELNEELARLEQEEVDKVLLDAEPPTQTELPEVPTAEPKKAIKKPTKVVDEEDDALEELRASMAI